MKNFEKRNIILIGIAAVAVIILITWLVEISDVHTYQLGGLLGDNEVDRDVDNYSDYMGPNAKEKYDSKLGMDETIFPEKITETMEVEDYVMVYCNPWDPQWVSLLRVKYDAEEYQKEVERLQAYKSSEYIGYYGIEGFDEDYQLLALYKDQYGYSGLVYALTDGEDEIIYVEMIFCNYFMDVNYERYIDKEYLPIGYDARPGNPYRDKYL